jgi:hypothetical protein
MNRPKPSFFALAPILIVALVTLQQQYSYLRWFRISFTREAFTIGPESESPLATKATGTTTCPTITEGSTNKSDASPFDADEATITEADANRTTINVLLCLSGSAYGLFEETKVALKSLILNAPHSPGRLDIYIVADEAARDTLQRRVWSEMLLFTNNTWWCAVSINVINIQSRIPSWKRAIRNLFFPLRIIDLSHTFGTFFRLFINQVLPSHITHVIYLDPDAIVLANLAHLWRLVTHLSITKNSSGANEPDDYLFSWRSETAGFMLMKNSPELFSLARRVNFSQATNERLNDQLVLKLLQRQFPHRVGRLPPEWGMHWAWDFKYRKALLRIYPQLGMGHFNGGADSKGPFWNESIQEDFAKYPEWSSMFVYYIRMEWTNVWFLGSSAATTNSRNMVMVTYHNDSWTRDIKLE